jgi:hypothetical protein
MKSNKERVLNYLRKKNSITVAEATRLGIDRLDARIYDLRQEGFEIYTNKKTLKSGPSRGQRVTSYRLAYDVETGEAL